MIGDISYASIIGKMTENAKNRRLCISLKAMPLKKNDTPLSREDLYYTDGQYNIRYSKKFSGVGTDFCYIFRCDIFDAGKVRVKNYKETIEYFKKTPGYQNLAEFLINYVPNFSDDTFYISKKNMELMIPIWFDVEKYERDVREKLGIEKTQRFPIFRELNEKEVEGILEKGSPAARRALYTLGYVDAEGKIIREE